MSNVLNPLQFFHGTSPENAETIAKEGLRSSGEGVYNLTQSRQAADEYSWTGSGFTGDGGIVEVNIPRHLEHQYVGYDSSAEDEHPNHAIGKAWMRRDIPASFVRRVR